MKLTKTPKILTNKIKQTNHPTINILVFFNRNKINIRESHAFDDSIIAPKFVKGFNMIGKCTVNVHKIEIVNITNTQIFHNDLSTIRTVLTLN